MGFSIAWIAIHGKTQRDILRALKMRHAQKIGVAPDAPFCYAKGYADGRRLWNLLHYLERGSFPLEADGAPPTGFAELLARAQERKVFYQLIEGSMQ